jgi:Flp pilus assembly protein TadG
MNTPSKREKGQALPLVTLGLIAMCGMMGLAVDLGWSYFVKRSAQSAADAAAQAAAEQALNTVGQGGTFSCAGQVTCQPLPVSCSASGNLTTGCLYAQQHDFTVGGHNGHQNVTIAADVTSPAPTAPGVTVDYWVTVRATESIPQLFSAVLGNTVGTSAARSTAAVLGVQLPAQVYALDRQNDAAPGSKMGSTGNDISIQGGGGIVAYGGVSLASTSASAGQLGGSGSVTAPATYIRGTGGYGNSGNWTATPTTGLPDGNLFTDPLESGTPPLGQPPAPTGLADHPILNGVVPPNQVLPSGNYYSVNSKGVPTGQPLTFGANTTFKNGPFGNFVIFGGIQGNVDFGPGRYIFVGSSTGTTLNWTSSMVQDQTPLDGSGNVTAPNDAGELFVLTDPKYPGLQIPSALSSAPAVLNSLAQGNVVITSGNSANWGVDLHGLNPSSSDVPLELKPFAPTLMWQDQANTTIKYNPDGSIDTSCGSLDSPCLNTNLKDPSSTYWTVDARPNVQLWGALYQPRGAGIFFQGHGTLTAPVQIVTGYISMQGGPTIVLSKLANGLRHRVTALIE